jgi:NAD-dependent deacetylase
MQKEIERAADILRRSTHAMALTGAGMSTGSGIPDFRSPRSGLWDTVNPLDVATIHAFRRNPQAFYDWLRPLASAVLNAEPNPAHVALAEMCEMGFLKAIVTQNIDGLHQRASAGVVFELHGNVRRAVCMRCYETAPVERFIGALLESGAVPRCERCSGVMKPNTILYGEQLPAREVLAAERAARESDVMIVAGSSLRALPAGNLPQLTLQNGGSLIFVNLGTTHLDALADVVIRADVVHALPELVCAVRTR